MNTKYNLERVVLSTCACGRVRDLNGSYITQEEALKKYDGRVALSHGVHSKECLKNFYGELMEIDYLPERCEGTPIGR